MLTNSPLTLSMIVHRTGLTWILFTFTFVKTHGVSKYCIKPIHTFLWETYSWCHTEQRGYCSSFRLSRNYGPLQCTEGGVVLRLTFWLPFLQANSSAYWPEVGGVTDWPMIASRVQDSRASSSSGQFPLQSCGQTAAGLKKSGHNVQQQCKQQLDYRSEGREAAPVRGQCPENQGRTNKHGRSSRTPAEWRRRPDLCSPPSPNTAKTSSYRRTRSHESSFGRV